MFTPGSRGCAYKTASGRGKWPNRDPLTEDGFGIMLDGKSSVFLLPLLRQSGYQLDLYDFVQNNSVNRYDPSGLCPVSAPPVPPDPCPGFESQWNDPLIKGGKRVIPPLPGAIPALCLGAATICFESCTEKYGSAADFEDGKSQSSPACLKKCNQDCAKKWLECNKR